MIKEQFESNSFYSDTFFMNLNNVQNIINEANKDLALSPIKQRCLNRQSTLSSIGNIIKQKEAS